MKGDGLSSAGHPPSEAVLGDCLALAGAIFAAGYFTIGRRLRERSPLVGYLTIVYGVGAAATLTAAWLHGDALGGYTGRQYLLFAAMAVVPSLTGHSLLNWAVRRMRIYVVNVAIMGEPILATLYAMVLFDERPGPIWGIGTAMILAGVLRVFLAEGTGSLAEATAE